MAGSEILTGLIRRFDEYAAPFLAGGRVAPLRLKADHCRRVLAAITDIARHEGLSGEDLELAGAAGLFHDIGRFEQYVKHGTFVDRKSLDHAALSVEVLERYGMLSALPSGSRSPVIAAIHWHNKLELPPGLGEKEKLFAFLLRDADKLDIYRVVVEYFEDPAREKNETVELDLPDEPHISGTILEKVRAGNAADYRDLRTVNDFKLLMMGWARGLHFRRTIELVRERGYARRLYKLLPQTPAVREAYLSVVAFLEKPAVKQ